MKINKEKLPWIPIIGGIICDVNETGFNYSSKKQIIFFLYHFIWVFIFAFLGKILIK